MEVYLQRNAFHCQNLVRKQEETKVAAEPQVTAAL